jgi:hypothetical protein
MLLHSFSVVVLLCLFAIPSRSRQITVTPTQNIVPTETIDGSKNPELIPDSVAYRLFFIHAALPLNATAPQLRRQRANLAATGLDPIDQLALAAALADFYSNHASFAEKYKDGDTGNLETDRDAVTQVTRDKLSQLLTPASLKKLDAFIQREKSGMKRIPMPVMQ